MWSRKWKLLIIIIDSIPATFLYIFDLPLLIIPWQPISLICIAVAFYLGFKNNSSYERVCETRKIWGVIVNTSRSITVMSRDFITNTHELEKRSESDLLAIRKRFVHRHIASVYALSIELLFPSNRGLEKYSHHHFPIRRLLSRFSAHENMFRSAI